MLCEYGCGQEAKYQFKNGKWCCSPKFNSCPEVRKKNSKTNKIKQSGKNNGMYGRKHSAISKRKNSESNKKQWENPDSTFNSKEYREKLRSKEILEKKRETSKNHYNTNHPMQSDLIKQKIEKNSLEKYGVKHWFQDKDIKQKIKETNIKKYGTKNAAQNTEIKERIKKTNLQKYGVEYVLQNTEIKERIKKTNLQKYGVKCVLQNTEIKEKVKKIREIRFKEKLNNYLEYLELELIGDYTNCFDRLEWKCTNCGYKFKQLWNTIQQGYKCPKCYPRYSRSHFEIEVENFIKSFYKGEIILNIKTIIPPYELDLYIPELNIAIECDGLYWHSEENIKHKDYHLKKTLSCKNNNIKLIHIFEDEWIFKTEIVKSRLKFILGYSDGLPINARDCIINEVSSKEKSSFLNKFHIQGNDTCKIKLGAFYNNELVSIMTFSHGNISKGSKAVKNVWELNRFCSDPKYNIRGIAGKLLSYFKNHYEWKQIFSYADRRWSEGNLYIKLGFTLIYTTSPNYWYISNGTRIHRFALRKKADEPKDIPEWVLRYKQGYSKIWDCGNFKFVLER